MKARRLRTIRELRGITQAQLSEMVPVSHRSISKWENGQRISPKMAQKVAEVLGVRVADLVGEDVTLPRDMLPADLVEGLMGDVAAEMAPVEVPVAGGGSVGVGSLRDYRRAADRLRRHVRSVEAGTVNEEEEWAVLEGVDALVRARKLVAELAPDHPVASDLDDLAEEVVELLSDLQAAYRRREAAVAARAEGLAPTA
jgi:transcriptional regulator with XRE-family HTH domain